VEHREPAVGHVGFLDRLLHRPADQFRSSGMGWPGLDDHRTSGRQRRGRIAPGHGEGQWKIARRKHDHRPDGNQHAAKVRLRDRPAVGDRPIDPRIDPRTFADHAGEQPQLTARAAAFHLEPSGGQARLGAAAVDQLVAQGLDPLGDPLQQPGGLGGVSRP